MLWLSVCLLSVLVFGHPSVKVEKDDVCERINCRGKEYECIDGQCFCVDGFVPNQYQTRCVRCPGYGEICHGSCCNYFGNGSIQCWQGVCQACYDPYGNFICRDNLQQILIVSTTQIAMATALILGILATFILLYKLCAVTSLRPLGGGPNCEGRLSIGSLQIYVEERLRDAPPRYTRSPPAGAAVYPATSYLNAGFIHDSSVPPPPYTPERKDEGNGNDALHI